LRNRRLVWKLLAATVFVALLPFCAITVIYLSTLNDLGDLPHPTPAPMLPRLITLGVWEDIGENAASFVVEPTWPWTPVLDLVLYRHPRMTIRPGADAANRVSGLWLSSTARTSMGKWHLRRAVLNVWLSRHWSASELTQEMAQKSFFGRHAIGIDQAARVYFGKTPETLQIGEVALLIGLLPSPSSLNCHPEKALVRRNVVLTRWATDGIIQSEMAAAEMVKPLGILPTLDSECGTKTSKP
jgi:hypothetical protein